MDTRNGQIHFSKIDALVLDRAQLRDAHAADIIWSQDRRHLKEMIVPPTALQRSRRRVGRNDPCPCGSGKKFKKCCLLG